MSIVAPILRDADIGDFGRFSAEGYAVAVVGAASGIGLAAASLMARLGASVACLDLDGEAARAAAMGLESQGLRAHAGALDVTQADATRTALCAAEAALGPLRALVNCAGITGTTNIPAHAVAPADFDRVCSVNLRGAFLLSQAVLPGMLERGYGRVLHVASIAGKEGNAGMAAYSASKAGLIGLVKSMAKDYAASGVTINAMAPAVIRTPLVDALPQATVDYMTSRIPMGRCGELDEVARAIAWAISPACSFVTGFTFDLSGGRATY